MRIALRRFMVTGCVVLAFGIGIGAQAQATLPCEASPEVKQALQSLPEDTGRMARVNAFRALLERFPNDLFVHQRYQDTAKYPTAKERDAVIAEYRALADKHPDSPLYAYLAARAQIGVNTKQLILQFERLAPSVPSAYLNLANIYQSPSFKDPKKARENLEGFIKVCPSSVRAFGYLRSMEPSDFLRQSVVRLRRLLTETNDPDSLASFNTLWALEFRVKPAAEHDTLRKQVAEDLERLRSIDPGKNRSYYSMMQEGYKLTADGDGGKWAAQQLQSVAPRTAYSSVISQWHEANPYPKENDPPEKRKTYNEARAKASAEWVRQWPESSYAWFTRVRALREIDQAEAADVEAAGDNLLKAIAKSPDEFSFMGTVGANSSALLVADLYAHKNVRLDRLPELVKQGITEIGKTRAAMDSDLYPRDTDDSNRDFNQWYGWTTIADIWLKVKDKEQAREALNQLLGFMEKSKPKLDSKDPADADKQRTYLSRQVDYWSRMGDLAKLQERKIDAITFYQNALLARVSPPSDAQKDELAAKARALWQDVGGSNEGWQAWSNRKDIFGQLPGVQAGGTWKKIEKRLPEFELADLNGAKWRLADFKGKTTLIGIWATW
jgi:tetratricopeptide (TPR) repeat protein